MADCSIHGRKETLGSTANDYAYLIEGLLELYQTTFDPKWFVAAQELAETMIAHFQAPEGVQEARTRQLPSDSARAGGIAGFFDTSDDHETLITRPRDLQDNAKLSALPIASVRQCDGRHRPLESTGDRHRR